VRDARGRGGAAGDLEAARDLLEQALNAFGVRCREDGPDEHGCGRGQRHGSDPG